MEYDLTDYSFYLEAELDAEIQRLSDEAMEREYAERQIADLELELEVKYMLEMI